MTWRRHSGEVSAGSRQARSSSGPRPARAVAGRAPARSWCRHQKAKAALRALPAPPQGSPHPARGPGPHFIIPWGHQPLPQPRCSSAGLQLPTAMPHVLARPQALPRKVPDAPSCGCLIARPPAACSWLGRWDGPRLPGLAAVSSTTISSIQKGGSCQQPVRQQKHPGTILAEENRKSSWSCCKAATATSMAFIYFCEGPYMQQLLCKWYISLQTAQFLAGNSSF